MALSSLVSALAAQISTAVENPPEVGAAPVTAVGDLPRVTVAVESATAAMRSVGQVPGPIETGALRIDVEIDLADPVLHFADEDVPLLSPNRRTFQLPHGSIVRASGDDLPPFTTSDLRVRVGTTTFTPVHAVPSAGQVALDIASGALTFPNPLPTSGTIELGYFVGTWEVRVERFAATAHLDVSAVSQASLETLVPEIERALSPLAFAAGSGVRRIEPVALSSATTIDGLPPAARRQRLTYQVDFELIEPIIPTSGGPIRRIDVTIQTPFGENFTITEASEP
ncbi:MAG: hypothetical protein ABWZ42_08510 [Ilumatobacteraceae bacterium]